VAADRGPAQRELGRQLPRPLRPVASVAAGAGGGLYWVLAGMICGLTSAIYYAWVLLVEIRR
jgi:hypothetical protein